MEAIETLLSTLDRVKRTGTGRWMACCPAHEDRTPSLSIKQVDDRILLHCFGGCAANDVLAAVGFSMTDLFSEPLAHHLRGGVGPTVPFRETAEDLTRCAWTVFSIATVMNDFGECGTDDRAKLLECCAIMDTRLKALGGSQWSK